MTTTSRSQNQHRLGAWFLLIIFINLMQGCMRYYEVTKPVEPPQDALIRLQDEQKFIILHQDSIVWQLTGITANSDSLIGKIGILTGHPKYQTTDPTRPNRYKKNTRIDESEVLSEVHIFTSDSVPSRINDTNRIAIPLAAINRIDVYDKNTGKTTASWIFGGLGIGVSVAAVVFIVILLVKESCPFIYVTHNNESQFIGEIYSGAIYPSLERHDYLPLPPPKPGKKDYTVKMTNEVHEIQHTNLIELLVFDHPQNTKVLLDKEGNYQTIANPITPISAVNLEGQSILEMIDREDTLSYLGGEIKKDPVLEEGIILKYDRPSDAKTAKLVIRAKNSFWLDYVFTRFHELFGKEYDCWVEKQEKIPDKLMKTWNLDQKIPLLVYIEKNGKWEFVDYFNVTGPMAAKEDVLPIDLSGVDTETVNIKLVYGFHFWEIDYAALDFSGNIAVKQRVALFERAVDNKNVDVKALMSFSDTLYYVQPEIGDEVNMKFRLPESEGEQQTVIMHSQGYYKILMNLTGEEQVQYLLPFRKKDRFSEYSWELFRQQYTH